MFCCLLLKLNKNNRSKRNYNSFIKTINMTDELLNKEYIKQKLEVMCIMNNSNVKELFEYVVSTVPKEFLQNFNLEAYENGEIIFFKNIHFEETSEKWMIDVYNKDGDFVYTYEIDDDELRLEIIIELKLKQNYDSNRNN
jgi:hypothetical protein